MFPNLSLIRLRSSMFLSIVICIFLEQQGCFELICVCSPQLEQQEWREALRGSREGRGLDGTSPFASRWYFEDIQILYQEDILKIFSFCIRIIFLYEMSAEIHSAFMLMTLRWYRKVQFSLPYGFSWCQKKLVRKRNKKIKDGEKKKKWFSKINICGKLKGCLQG